MIEVLTNGALNLIVDSGRIGYMDLGISRAGAIDQWALALANAMACNESSAAGLEISIFPFRALFLADCVVAVTGAAVDLALENRKLPPWWAFRVRCGETVTLGPPRLGTRAYLAVGGGVDVPLVLGSRTTDLKGCFGGLQGRGLRKGDKLEIGESGPRESRLPANGFGIAPPSLQQYWSELRSGSVNISVLAGAEYGDFSELAQQNLVTSEYCVTPESNRQGYRLQGPPLTLSQPMELLSHGIVPGTVQVPPSGQPIVQLADANTCGGYPKIATVASSELWRFGQLGAGTRVKFKLVDFDAADQSTRRQAEEFSATRQSASLMALRA